jgi:hypothetical protein
MLTPSTGPLSGSQYSLIFKFKESEAQRPEQFVSQSSPSLEGFNSHAIVYDLLTTLRTHGFSAQGYHQMRWDEPDDWMLYVDKPASPAIRNYILATVHSVLKQALPSQWKNHHAQLQDWFHNALCFPSIEPLPPPDQDEQHNLPF